MKLTQKLLGFLHRAFSRDPIQFLALRLRYDGGMKWEVADAVLTTSVSGGSGTDLQIDLNQYTIADLVNFLNLQPGYTVVYQAPPEPSTLGARILIDSHGDQDQSNGDHIYAFTSLTWAVLDSSAVELRAAREQIYQMLRQMTVATAESEWLDEIGDYYSVKRQNGEPDSLYGPRIIYEVIRPRNNNKAIEQAISVATGGLPSRVVDVTELDGVAPVYDGSVSYDGTYLHDASGRYRRNLFDVEYAFDLDGSEDIAPFQLRVMSLIDKFRSAGNHLRQIVLTGSQLSDNVALTTSDGHALQSSYEVSDTISAPGEACSLSTSMLLSDSALPLDHDSGSLEFLSTHTYNGAHTYGGSGRLVLYSSGETVTEAL